VLLVSACVVVSYIAKCKTTLSDCQVEPERDFVEFDMGSAIARAPIGDNIRRLRELRGMSQAELARRATMDQAHLSRIEDGTYASPRHANLEKIARALNCEIAELTGREALRQVTPYESNPEYREMIDALEKATAEDRREIVRHTLWAARRAGRSGADLSDHERMMMAANEHAEVMSRPIEVRLMPRSEGADDGFPFTRETFIEKDFDFPRSLHALAIPIDAEIAAGEPMNPDDVLIPEAPAARVLHSVKEIRDDRLKVIKVYGDSMQPTFRSGWKVLLDTTRKDPRFWKTKQIVAVYVKDEGSVLGRFNREERAIEKDNAAYRAVKLVAGEWYPLGLITMIVEAPVELE